MLAPIAKNYNDEYWNCSDTQRKQRWPHLRPTLLLSAHISLFWDMDRIFGFQPSFGLTSGELSTGCPIAVPKSTSPDLAAICSNHVKRKCCRIFGIGMRSPSDRAR